jgi:hypothetical protein
MAFKSQDPQRQAAHENIVRNLRAKYDGLTRFTDEQIYDAWDSWSESDQYPHFFLEWLQDEYPAAEA